MKVKLLEKIKDLPDNLEVKIVCDHAVDDPYEIIDSFAITGSLVAGVNGFYISYP